MLLALLVAFEHSLESHRRYAAKLRAMIEESRDPTSAEWAELDDAIAEAHSSLADAVVSLGLPDDSTESLSNPGEPADAGGPGD